MKRELQITADGSHTIAIPELNVTYRSTFGAIQESRHIFIEAGLQYVLSRFSSRNDCIRVFEAGFGTGLNALLSYKEAKSKQRCLYYYMVEPYPLTTEEAEQLNYVSQLNDETLAQPFSLLHRCAWNADVMIAPFFTFYKSIASLSDLPTDKPVHLIYFDAFAPDVQPDLWQPVVFDKMYRILYAGGALVTYCSKGAVRRAMQSVGFSVEKLSGPPGKREIIRAVKRE